MPDELERAREEAERWRARAEMLEQRSAAREASLRVQLQHLLDLNRRDRQRLDRLYKSRAWVVLRLAVRLMRAVRAPKEILRALKRGRRPTLPDVTAVPPPAPISVARYAASENTEIRDVYERALSKRSFTGSGETRIAIAVHTTDLSLGRGDVYVGVGLGRYLERIGYEVVYLPRAEWNAVPEGTDVYLALLDDIDLMQVPATCTRIAWIRNRTTQWIDSGSLQLYDAVLCSSEHSLAEVKRAYPGPTGLLRIGVDHELFRPSEDSAGRTGVVTTVNQWGTERELFRSLVRCRLDFPLAVYGEQRGLLPDIAPFWQGKLSFFALPSVYAQAAVVLDDHNHTTQPFGNVNSRVYEALACGAPLITNSSLGLHEIGLADVPTYTGAAELDELIHDMVGDPEGAGTLAKSLQRRVLEEHTFERRAEQFDAFLERIKEMKTDKIVVGFFPDYRSANPYQSLLYGWGERDEIAAVPVPHPKFLASSALVRSARAFVYHLHWTSPILSGARTESAARQRMADFIEGIDALRRAGATFAWTIHNVLPHELRFAEIEAELGQALADRADLIHVMCEDTADLVAAHYTLPADRVRILPLPNYIGVYPNIVDQQAARAELDIPEKDTVIGFFGGIRPYKGIEQLLDAFEELSTVDDRLHLIIAGPTEHSIDMEDIRRRCVSHPRITANFNRIADGDVQIFINAADVVVLPHRAVLNSASLLLALSFGRPVIAPVTGCVRDLLTPDVSVTFTAGDTASLRDALSRAHEMRGNEWRRAAFEKASTYDPKEIASGFVELVRAATR